MFKPKKSFKALLENLKTPPKPIDFETKMKQEKDFKYYFGIFGEAIVIFLMYAIPLTIFGLALYGLYRLVTG
ncbi:MAG: hypothetical protein KA146_06200 [Leptospiraceae bacterium]|nr:hypothetical protein [Leptospiraceae bacterium]